MNKLLSVAAVAVIVAGAFYVFRPAGHLRPFDADLRPLAESHLEGFCAGLVFWQTRAAGDPDQVAECRRAEPYSTDVDLDVVVPAFCDGVAKGGFDGSRKGCVDTLYERQLWPTLHGQLSDAWNRAYPYPGQTLINEPTDDRGNSRTGDRQVIPR